MLELIYKEVLKEEVVNVSRSSDRLNGVYFEKSLNGAIFVIIYSFETSTYTPKSKKIYQSKKIIVYIFTVVGLVKLTSKTIRVRQNLWQAKQKT